MDPLDELLRGLRADAVGFDRRELTPPWTLRSADAAILTLYAPLRGTVWLTHPEDESPRPVRVGETAIVRGTFVLADRPLPAGSGEQVPARPADRMWTGSGEQAPVDDTVLLVGTYDTRGMAARRLLDALPPVLVVPDGDGCESVRDFLDTQAACPGGPQVVRDRLVDWLVVCTLRSWFDQPGAVPSGRLRAWGDDVIGPVLRAMHAAPDRPWTLAALAGEAGVSRTTVASRFARLVGDPPLTYLTEWRMTLAADLLAGSTTTVAAVARRVGYADAFGFSAAFKRFHGVSPSAYRGRSTGTMAACR
ncbi:AraC family transcriptional regulator [Plantactinospora sp. GCM10030261]|uniref:AraC family transcriptional regulator n=1 Tax=Plantactinospora sp. GCM10030261 TaxID=3273420 RepID=UPI003611A07D